MPNSCWFCGVPLSYSKPQACPKHWDEIRREYSILLKEVRYKELDKRLNLPRVKRLPSTRCHLCSKPVHARGLCRKHYNQEWTRHSHLDYDKIKYSPVDLDHLIVPTYPI